MLSPSFVGGDPGECIVFSPRRRENRGKLPPGRHGLDGIKENLMIGKPVSVGRRILAMEKEVGLAVFEG